MGRLVDQPFQDSVESLGMLRALRFILPLLACVVTSLRPRLECTDHIRTSLAVIHRVVASRCFGENFINGPSS